MKKLAFTLCSNNYLAQAKTLGDSLVLHNPDYEFIIGLVDKKNSDIDYSFFHPHKVLQFDALPFPVLHEMIGRYNIVEFNTAVKPFYFRHLCSELNDRDIVLYIDPDIQVFSSFNELESILSSSDFVLTPHILYPLEAQGYFEQLILNVGIFNLGFLGIAKSSESLKFLHWWSARLEKNCKIDFKNGLFVDQIWANYLPVLFQNVQILLDPGYNMGYWNFEERTLSWRGGRYMVNHDYDLKFFHFSSYDASKPGKLCRWLPYSFEARKDLVDIYDQYRAQLITNQYEYFSKLGRQLNFRKNHPTFDKVQDSAYQLFGRRVKFKINKFLDFCFGIK